MHVPVTMILVLAAGLAAVPSALAQQDRFTLERSGDRFVLMDGQTGEMSVCEERGSQFVCRLAADERTALQDEIGELSSRIEALERRLAALEQGTPAAPGQNALPSEEEVEGAFALMERFFRRFMGMVRDLERDFGGEAPPVERPERT